MCSSLTKLAATLHIVSFCTSSMPPSFSLSLSLSICAPQDEQNLLIPIHAYPVLNTAKFPRHVKFPSTPIGQTRTKTVSLECDVPIQFEYQLTYLQSHPAFTVEPMNG